MAGGGLLAMVVVKKVALGEGRALGSAAWGSAPPATTMASFGRLK